MAARRLRGARGARDTGMLNMVHLQTLQAVLATGSLSGAAKELGYTTSAVSQQIAALERTLGVRLFERGPRNLWPTTAALQMGRHATALLSRLEEAEEDIRGYADGNRGRLRVAAFPTVSAQLLPKALRRLVARLPDAEITLQNDGDPTDVALAVCEGRADLGLVYAYDLVPETWPGELTLRPILDEELIVLCGPDQHTADAHHVDLRELSGAIWVTNDEGTAAHHNLLRLCAQSGFRPEIRFTSNDYDVIRGIVRENLGVAMVPALSLGIDRAITMRRMRTRGPRRKVLAVHRSTDPNPLVPAAVDAIREAAAEFVTWTTEAFGARVDSPLATTPG
ncbi:LysR family transcriptional regulator [Streptomyces sp. NPDC021098]|uniref:LysR family transcriptional regulator n=1 Tax=unclassified Streptomyces TaxID=2593676 RepID=UPI0037ACBAF4